MISFDNLSSEQIDIINYDGNIAQEVVNQQP